jgi:hypothetical protein
MISFFSYQQKVSFLFFSKEKNELYNTVCAKEENTPQQQQRKRKKTQ